MFSQLFPVYSYFFRKFELKRKFQPKNRFNRLCLSILIFNFLNLFLLLNINFGGLNLNFTHIDVLDLFLYDIVSISV